MAGAPPHILVIRRRYLGDIVLLGSVFRTLKLHWPQARIAVLCEGSYADILKLNPDVAEVFHFPKRALEWPKLMLALRRANFSHVLDLDNRDKTAVLTRATCAPVRVTQRHTEQVHLPSFYTRSEVLPTEFLEGRHITDLYLHLLAAIDVPIVTRETKLHPRPADHAAIRPLLDSVRSKTQNQKSKILIHPGSRSAWRVWPPENFARVIDALAEQHNCGAVIVSGPGERATVDAICAATKHVPARIDDPLPLPQLAALFASFPVLLCHDSGPMHVATAVGTKVVALYGSQILSHWRPLGEGHTTLQPPLPCVTCVSPGQCNPHDAYHNHCVRNITPERVAVAVATKLDRACA